MDHQDIFVEAGDTANGRYEVQIITAGESKELRIASDDLAQQMQLYALKIIEHPTAAEVNLYDLKQCLHLAHWSPAEITQRVLDAEKAA